MQHNNANNNSAPKDNEKLAARLAVLGGGITTLGDAIATLGALIALEEIENSSDPAQNNNNNNNQMIQMQKQIDMLTKKVNDLQTKKPRL